MKNAPQSWINCALIEYSRHSYLLPTVAIAEVNLPKFDEMHIDCRLAMQAPFCLGTFVWRGLTLPIISMDLLPFNLMSLHHPKMAVIHSLFSPQSVHPSYFIYIFEGKVRKIKVTPDKLIWIDESQKMAQLTIKDEKIEVTLVDLRHISNKVEFMLTEKERCKKT